MRTKCLASVFLKAITKSVMAEHLKVDMSVSGRPGGAAGFTNRAIVNSTINTYTATLDGISSATITPSPSLRPTQYLNRVYYSQQKADY